jgi:hypothetical protein
MVLQLLLGANFVDNNVFQFDCVNERMRLITRDSVNLKSIRNVDAKLDRSSGALLIRVGLTEDRNAWLQMDTGSNGGILIDRKLANSLEWPSTLPKVNGESYGVNGSG